MGMRIEYSSERLGKIAARVLASNKYSADIKALAGSVLTQLRNKKDNK